jgi:hypothetical protein
VGRVKCEQEVSVLCWWFVYRCVCVCVLYGTLCSVAHSFHTCISHHFSFCLSTSRCTCVIRSVWSLSVQIITYFLFPTPHRQLPYCLWQSVLMLCKGGWRGCGGNVGNSWECQNGVCLCEFAKYWK